MNDIRSTETKARHDLATRIDDGHLTREELWNLSELVRMVGVLAERGDEDEGMRAAHWMHTVQEYRRLVPEGGETA